MSMNVYLIIGAGAVILVALFLFLNKSKSKSKKSTEEKKSSTQNNTSIKEPVRQEKPRVKLPQCNFPPFDHSRLAEMGLAEDEVSEFIQELIPQIGAQIPLIEAALENSDFDELEHLTHAIKGSSSTVGSGGVSDLLAEFNTYTKAGKEKEIILHYIKYLKHYHAQLLKQYP